MGKEAKVRAMRKKLRALLTEGRNLPSARTRSERRCLIRAVHAEWWRVAFGRAPLADELTYAARRRLAPPFQGFRGRHR